MSKKLSAKSAVAKSAAIDPKATVCLEEGCSNSASIKGYCRLHFLKLLKGKAEGPATSTKEHLRLVRERRKSGGERLKSLEPNNEVDETALEHTVEQMGELDTDVDMDGLEDALNFGATPRRSHHRKAG